MGSSDLLEVLGKKYNIDILRVTDEPHSAQELSDELDVPIATCYRRIEELTEVGLLEHHDRVLTDDRRRISVYRRNVNELRVEFMDTAYSIQIEERTDVKNKLDDVWRTLSDP